MSKIYNGGHEPLVYDWDKPAVPPGGSVETDHPESFSRPWTEDPAEAASAAATHVAGVSPDFPSDGVSGAQDAPEGTSELEPDPGISEPGASPVEPPPASSEAANPQEA